MQQMQMIKRKEKDILRLKTAFRVNTDDPCQLQVSIQGPRDSIYEKIGVCFPDQYPYKSPSVGFLTKIYHPNVDEASGSICLDVINQAWSPMYDLLNIFEQFLPQLLLYPNPHDPLNPEAASLLLKQPENYKQRVQDYIRKYAIDHERKISDASTKPDLDIEDDFSDISEQSELSQTSNILTDF